MNVIFGVVLAAVIIGSVLIQHWPVIAALSGGAAAFLGAMVGAAGGLGAILLGALYNAKLNRDENKRLRREEGRALALALRGETLSVADSYRRHKAMSSGALQKVADRAEDETIRLRTHSACSIAIFSKSSDRLGFLEDPELIANLAQFYSVLPTEVVNAEVKVQDLRNLVQTVPIRLRQTPTTCSMSRRTIGRGTLHIVGICVNRIGTVQTYQKLDDTMIERANDLAEKLKAAAAYLAPQP